MSKPADGWLIVNPMWDHLMAHVPTEKWYGEVEQFKFYELCGQHFTDFRHPACKRWSWAIAAPESVDWIASQLRRLGHTKVVEVGCGTGYWLWLLEQVGFEVTGYDKDPPDLGENHYHHEGEMGGDPKGPVDTWIPVLHGSTEMLALHEDDALLLCWPPYDDPLGFEVLRAYKGNTVIYIGEGHWGCTGTDAMHDELEQRWTRGEYGPLKNWVGIHDHLVVYTRNTEA